MPYIKWKQALYRHLQEQPIGSNAINAGLRDQLWTRYQELNPSSKGLYNGNISWMVTNLPELGRQANDASKGMQAMLYSYDQLNRISAASSLTSYVAGTGFGARTTTPEAYDTRYSYDANGNLLTLQRWNEQVALQDDFTYNYYAGTNKLKYLGPEVVAGDKVYGAGEVISDGKVYQNVILQSGAYVSTGSRVELLATSSIQMHPDVEIKEGADFQTRLVDGGAETGGDIAGVENDEVYLYDGIGNLVADHSEGIEIGWTVYGKIREVRKTDGTILHFSYDAAGNRVEKQVSKAGTVVTTRYIRDASGNVMAIYQDDALTEQPLYGSSRLGSYRGGRLNGERQLGHKQYELSNHLGNVLAVVTDNISLSQDASLAHVVTISDYYPFGSLMPGRSYNSKEYRYGYNGKELDKEGMGGGGSTYDYGFRIYNPQIAKFLSVDPLSPQYPFYSPYQYAGNKPIKFVDVDGLEEGFNIRFEQMQRGYLKGTVSEKELMEFHQANAAGAALGIGVLVTRGAILRYGPQLFTWALTNPHSAQNVAVGILAGIVGYDGADLPGQYDDFARMGRRGYQALAKNGATTEELRYVARSAYNKIVGTIDDEIKGLKSLKEKAQKAYSIRNKAKDFARELSGPENTAAAEAMSSTKHGSSKGPIFDDLFQKAKDNGMTDDEAYNSIIESSKRTSPEVNAKYDKK
jgi:RHS repeat-associated protein